jgi:hypothetical protein
MNPGTVRTPTDDVGERWVHVGRSLDPDPRSAGERAATEALAGRSSRLLLVFCRSRWDAKAVLEGVCAVTPDDTVVAGGTTVGEIAPGGPGLEELGNAPGVVVIALGGPGFAVASTVSRAASEHRRESGAEVAGALASITLPNRALLLIADGLSREQHEIVRGAYGVLGALTPIVGGCSADDLEYLATYQFHGTGAGVEVLQDAVVGIGLGSNAPLGLGIAHGWTKVGDAMLITDSVGGVVHTLDDAPAAEMFLSRIAGSPLSLDEARALRENDPPAFLDILFRNPLGLSRRTGEDLRVVHDIDFDTGAVVCLADVPQGALAWVMTTDREALVSAAADSCSGAIAALEGADPLGFLVFDCGARKIKLEADGVRAEQQAIGRLVGERPFGGFYTYGEVARMEGARGMHQLTVVTLAIA